MKRLILSIACCALVASLAFGQDPQTATVENRVMVTATAPTMTVERGEAAKYQPPNTLVVYYKGRDQYVLDGSGHVFDSKGNAVQSAVRPRAHVRVFFANNGHVRTIDHVVVD
jgi:hypothetical protein